MTILTSLPTELSTTILAEWLNFKHSVRLDTAFCHKTERDGFLALLKASDCVYAVPDAAYDREETTHVVKWVAKRGIKVSNVKFTRSIDYDTFSTLMNATGDRLVTVQFANIKSASSMERMLSEVAERSREVTELSLFECAVTTPMWSLFGRFSRLTKVSLCSDRPLSPPPVNVNLGQCPLLRSVSMAGAGIMSEGAVALVERAPRGGILQLSLVGMIFLHDLAIVHIAKHCPHLRVLGLAHMAPRMSNAVLTYIAELCPHICHLDVSYNTQNDESLIPVIRTLKLQSLCVDDNILLTDAVLEEVELHQAQTLHTLFVSNCPDFSAFRIQRLVQNCPHLHTLSVGGDEDIEELFIEEFVLDIAHVETLLLYGEDLRSDNLSHIARHCRHLKHLGVISKRSIKKGLLEVVQRCKELQALHVHKTDPRSLAQWRKINPDLIVRKVQGDYHYFDVLSAEP